MKTPCKFSFDHTDPDFDGFMDGTTWNGFDTTAS